MQIGPRIRVGGTIGQVGQNVKNAVTKGATDVGHAVGQVADNKYTQMAAAAALAATGVGAPAAAGIMAGVAGGGALLKPGGNIGQGVTHGITGAAMGYGAGQLGSALHAPGGLLGGAAPAAGGGVGGVADASTVFGGGAGGVGNVADASTVFGGTGGGAGGATSSVLGRLGLTGKDAIGILGGIAGGVQDQRNADANRDLDASQFDRSFGLQKQQYNDQYARQASTSAGLSPVIQRLLGQWGGAGLGDLVGGQPHPMPAPQQPQVMRQPAPVPMRPRPENQPSDPILGRLGYPRPQMQRAA